MPPQKEHNPSKLKNIVIIYDFGRNVGGINPVSALPAISLSNKYNVYYCAADTEFHLIENTKIHKITLSKAGSKNNREINRAISSLWNLKAQSGLRELLTKLSPKETIVHFHGWGMALSSSVIKTSFEMDFKSIYTAHDYSIMCPNGVYYDFNNNSDCTKKPLSIDCCTTNCDKKNYLIKLHRVTRKKIDEEISKASKTFSNIICVSELVKSVLCEWGLPKNKLTVLQNPTSAEKTKIDAEKNKTFIYLGRITPEKGVYDFCEATKISGVESLIIGDGEYAKKIKEDYPNIRITGWLNKKEINEELKNARCLVIPSRWREASGLVVEEAMSKGIPVITSSDTGSAEKITKYGGGIIFKKGDIASLSEAISHMAKDGSAAFYSQECLNATNHFLSHETYAKNLEKIYNSTLNEL